MPNHITNEITFGTDSAALAAFQKMLTEMRADDGPLGSIDFNKLIPMPRSLNIESGSRTNAGLDMYIAFLKESRSVALQGLTFTPKAHEVAVQRHLAKFTAKKDADLEVWELSEQAFQNIQKYGCATWYEWAPQHWGTKWNAYDCCPLGPQSHTMRFLTAWNGVPKILEALSKKYPDQRITYRWADEDIGYNVGEMTFEKGKTVAQDIPAGGSREAYEMAADIKGSALENYGLHLSQDGTTYEYQEEATEQPVAQRRETPKKTKSKKEEHKYER
ncbi:MAG: hypothetical protein EOM52_11480 [Clostridia bacterium]|nr:hypothetical protein [Clostridia bacterium]